MTAMAHYLIVRRPDSLDLAAAEKAMAEQDFEVWLQREQRSDGAFSISVRWQPDAMLHTDQQIDGLFTKPAAETHVLRFDNGPAAHSALQDIAQSLEEDGVEVPFPLERDSLIYLQELDADRLPRSTLGMRYALLAELLATAARPREVLIYEPIGAICIDQRDAHELMDWREMLELLDNPLPIPEFTGGEDPDVHRGSPLETGGSLVTAGMPLGAPGQQGNGASWLWSAGTLAGLVAVAAWMAWR
ncbi:MAG: hypothetical protein EOO28_35745 [Comamonadaceae bacterium]|nr:MAG: hypothetical protein EOO28_35745 [Comamonadaceae bacterium]